MKKLGINIDGCIRDFHNQFDKQYRKVFIHNPSIVDMDEETHTYKAASDIDEQELEKRIQEKERELITMPVDSFELLNHYRFDSKSIKMTKLEATEDVNYAPIEFTPRENLENFLYETYPMQLYTMADEYPGATDSINKIQQMGLSSGLFEVVLLSTLKGKAVPATYSFLGKTNCRIKKIVFLGSDSEKWDYCDAIVDIMPATFQSRPDGKTSIKINHLFNQWDQADFSFDNLKQLCNKDLFDRIFKNNNLQ